jgi:3-hydroxybutyryl-CoA dehydrogenase
MLAFFSRNISTIGVVGAGQMGTGIAIVASNSAKLKVNIFDSSSDQHKKSQSFVADWLQKKLKKNEINDAEEFKSRLSHTSDLSKISECDFVIEAITEDFSAKSSLFHQINPHLSNDAILATNTSSISITKLAAIAKNPEKVIGMHFMNPVPVMTLVEVIKGLQTSSETTAKTLDLAKKMGKTCTESQDRPGFIANRVLMPYINEAIQVLNEGVASREDIDSTMKLGTNVPMGPLQLADFIGLDTCLSIMKVLHSEMGDSKYRPSTLLVNYVNAGWLGKKTGKGFYEYKKN